MSPSHEPAGHRPPDVGSAAFVETATPLVAAAPVTAAASSETANAVAAVVAYWKRSRMRRLTSRTLLNTPSTKPEPRS